MLHRQNTVLLVVDVQGKLADLMQGRDAMLANLGKCIRGAQVLDIPILWAEQNPERMGPTVPEIAGLLEAYRPISKLSFSCCRHPPLMQALRELQRRQVLLAGIEAHICIYQTAADLLAEGFETHVVVDAVASRKAENHHLALRKLQALGAQLTGTEMALFEMLGVAEGECFKQILRIIK
ncbi:MAG: hydrolase [Kiritimatiellia bacterium]|nr:hydrolase [Lentisphaerota bacterium]